jgi:hypothetical protein
MKLLTEAMSDLGAAMLPVVSALLLEELTFGGLVRLLMAPRPGASQHGVSGDAQRAPTSSLGCKRGKHNKQEGEGK